MGLHASYWKERLMMEDFSKVLRSRPALLALALVLGVCGSARAQISAYGMFTASELNQGSSSNTLYGGTAGVLFDGANFFRRVVVAGDIQFRDVDGSGERLVGLGAGPRVSVRLEKIGLAPYAEFLVGFDRYRASTQPGVQNTTDEQWQANVGVAKRMTPWFDLVAEYSYSQDGANLGEYTPKSFSVGAIFHFTKR
jgi:hypothetical protein